MPRGVEAQEGGQIPRGSVNAVLEEWGNTEYLHEVLGIADPAIASTSWADQREPDQQARQRNRSRAVSSVSHTNLDYFDPRGVGALRRTLSRMSTARNEAALRGYPEQNLGLPGQAPPTADVADGVFDFEAVLRDMLKRCEPQLRKLPFRTDPGFGSQAW